MTTRPQPVTLHALRQRMSATGIGFAGIDGAWWQPATEPFALPYHLQGELGHMQQAIFLLLDSVSDLLRADDPAVTALLTDKVPESILRLMANGRSLSIRPDFQLCPTQSGLKLVATELEIAPSAQGFAHAMQSGYGLVPDLAQTFARFLDDRPLLIAGTHQWSAFMFDQLAFCKSLHEFGGRGYLLFDKPLALLQAEALAGTLWQLPMFGIARRPSRWHTDIHARLEQHGLAEFWWPGAADWPVNVGQAVVFRFGYFDTFSQEHLRHFARWQAQGATFLNPLQFILDSKVILAARHLPAVRQAIASRDAAALAVLNRCLPETHLVTPANASRFVQDKDRWVIKFAGYDGGNQSWGGVSLHVGSGLSQAAWAAVVRRCLALPWPVVAQRVAPSLVQDVDFWAEDGSRQTMRNGRSRLRVFFVRGQPPCGAHVTFSADTMQVSEGIAAVQAPVAWISASDMQAAIG